jgi:nicotinate dehydrogenase subunit B
MRNIDNRDADENSSGLARRAFLKTTGALVVGFSVAQMPAAQAQDPGATAWERGVKSGPPDPAEVDSYLAVHPNNTATIFAGYVDLGQGGPTAICQIAAEELDLDFNQVLIVRNDTFVTTNGSTLASRTAAIGGTEMRVAAAEARRVLLGLASERLKAPVQDLTVAKGVVSVRRDPQRSVTYGELLGNKPFGRKFEAVVYSAGAEVPRKSRDVAPFKSRAAYTSVGTRVPRVDMPDKVSGTYEYMQHVRVPGMLHGRVVWPQGQVAGGVTPPKVVSVDDQSIKDIPGVRIVRRNNFIGVVAEREWDAVRASRQLKVTWEPFPAVFAGHDGIHDNFRAAKTNDLVVVNTGDATAVLTQPQPGLRVASASYRGPYESHGTMAPNCAVADVTRDGALVMCSSQAIYGTRNGLTRLLGFPIEKIRVQYYAGSNTYGSSCYTDVAEAAAILSQEVGKPVRLQLSRQDEFGWDNYGPAHLAEIRGAVDANGKIVAFEYQAWGHDGNGVGTASQLLAIGAAAQRGGGPGGGDAQRGRAEGPGGNGLRGAAPTGQRGGGGQVVAGGLYQVRISQNDMYDIPNRRMVEHRVPGRGYLKLGALRAPLDPPYFFAQEGMMDELAYLAQLDPYEFRKRNISHPRWLGVLKAAAEAAKWTPRVAASRVTGARVAVGRGIGLGTHHLIPNQGDRVTFAAAVVEIEVNKDNGVVVAKHVYGAMDCGLAINPGIVESQIVGMSVHGTSLALKEEVHFNQTNVTSLDWNSYQTLRFGEHPAVTPIVVQQINEKSSGAGEEVLPAVVGAIGNAFFDATGVRLRQFPLTPQRVLAALKSAPTRPNPPA